MANKRMLDRAITRGRRIKLLSDGAALLYTWAIPFTDDFGRIDGDPEVVWADIFSLRKGWNHQKVAKAMLEWVTVGLGIWYQEGTHIVFQFDQDNFEEFQKGIIHKRTASKYPDPSNGCIFITSENFREFLGDSEKFRSNLTYPNLTKPKGTEGSEKSEKQVYGEFQTVQLLPKEVTTLTNEFGQDGLEKLITKLDSHKASFGQKYKSDYAAIRKWVIQAVFGENGKSPPDVRQKQQAIDCDAEMKNYQCNTERGLGNQHDYCIHCPRASRDNNNQGANVSTGSQQ